MDEVADAMSVSEPGRTWRPAGHGYGLVTVSTSPGRWAGAARPIFAEGTLCGSRTSRSAGHERKKTLDDFCTPFTGRGQRPRLVKPHTATDVTRR